MVTVTVGPEAGAVPVGSGGPRNVEFAQFFRAEHSKLIRFVMATGAGKTLAGFLPKAHVRP